LLSSNIRSIFQRLKATRSKVSKGVSAGALLRKNFTSSGCSTL
jgi:hypothetical protein